MHITVGGHLATLAAREILKDYPYIDSAVIGYGEKVIVALAEAISLRKPLKGINGLVYRVDNKICTNLPRYTTINIDAIPFPIATENKTIILSTGATNPNLSGSSPYFFRIWNSDAEEGVFAAKFTKENLNLERIAVMYVNNDYGKGLYEVFRKHFEELGGEIVGGIDFDINARDFRDVITKVKALSPEGIYLVGYAPQTGVITKQLREQGVEAKIIGTVATEDPKFLELAGKAAEGVIYVYPKPPSGRVPEHFKKAFQEKYGKAPEILCDVGYDAAKLIAYAYEQGAKNGDDIRRIFHQIRGFEGASGLIEFDENGDVHKPMIMKTIRDGKFVIFEEE